VQDITTIPLPMPYRLGAVNAYLLRTTTGFVLIDTGPANSRAMLERALANAGCTPGNLDLIVLTHGDFDHTGNAAYLREQYGAQIAMHRDDAGMAQHGDMFWNRSSGNAIIRVLAPVLFRFSKAKRFTPDLYPEEGDTFSEYGFDAQALSLPGHSKGSLGVLTAAGDLFCGDLLENQDKPAPNAIMDDPAACAASIEKLKRYDIDTVYPGHGGPFPIDALVGPGQVHTQ
jgi:hydroxyacylglutathione hydrolase